MSGGRFDYDQYRIGHICEEVKTIIYNNDSEEVNEWGDRIGEGLSPKTIARFQEAVYFLTMAEIYAQRIDWLVSGDDGEDSFHKRLEQELENVKNSFGVHSGKV